MQVGEASRYSLWGCSQIGLLPVMDGQRGKQRMENGFSNEALMLTSLINCTLSLEASTIKPFKICEARMI